MWKAAVIATNVLLVALTVTRAYKRWPALYAYVIAMCAQQDLGLVASITRSGWQYWWDYYIGDAVVAITEVAVITEISLKLIGPLKKLRWIASWNVPAMTMTFIGVSMIATASGHLHDHLSHCETIEYYCRRLDLAVWLGCSAGLIMLIGIAVSLKIQFSHGVKPIAIGMLVEVSFTYVQAVNMMDGWVAQTVFPGVRSLAYLVSLICFSAPAIPHKRRGDNFFSSSTSAPFLTKGARANV